MYNGIGYTNYKGDDRIREMYRQFTGLTEDVEFSKDNLNQRMVKRVACFSRKSPEKVKSILLNEEYQGDD